MSYLSRNNCFKVLSVSSLPDTGTLNTIYINTNTNTLWLYDGSLGWISRSYFSDFIFDYYARFADIVTNNYIGIFRDIIVLRDENNNNEIGRYFSNPLTQQFQEILLL